MSDVSDPPPPSDEQIEHAFADAEGLLVGPTWISLAVEVTPQAAIPTPIIGVKATDAMREVIGRAKEDHYFESGWRLLRRWPEPPVAYLDIEFYSPVLAHMTLKFTLEHEAIFEVLLVNGGNLMLALTKEGYKKGEAVGIPDVATDVPEALIYYIEHPTEQA